jgi:hypothetical protein
LPQGFYIISFNGKMHQRFQIIRWENNIKLIATVILTNNYLLIKKKWFA